MKNQNENISRFLQFNNTNLLFTDVEGTTYVAIKPICEALKVAYAAQLRRVKKDQILAPALSIWTIQVGNLQGRQYTCIPEKYVYGWIFSINSERPELTQFKRECYDLLYNHFHGVIGKRKELLIGVAETQAKIFDLKHKLMNNDDFKNLMLLESNKKAFTSEMKKIDNLVIGQVELDLN